MSELVGLRALQARWLSLDCAANPAEATMLGITAYDDTLADHGRDALRRAEQDRQDLLDSVRSLPVPSGRSEMEWRHERMLLEADLAFSSLVHRLEPEMRAPYIYPEEVGQGLHCLMADGARPARLRDLAVLSRLRLAPEVLAQGVANLDPSSVPGIWLNIGLAAARGLAAFLDEDLMRFLNDSTLDAGEFEGPLACAQQEAVRFTQALETMANRTAGVFAVGARHVEELLKSCHLLPEVTAASLAEFGARMVEETEAQMQEHAWEIIPGGGWRQALDKMKDDHPDADGLLQAYRDARDAALDHLIAHDLISIPAEQSCTVEETPSFLRSSIPLGVMNTSPPFASDNVSRLLITPVDPAAEPARRMEYLREQNHGFIRSITFHEIYPGHHLQSVLHKRAASPIAKKFRSPLFVEGWGLYTEDLMEETGFLGTPALRFLKARNALWRAVRILIDMGMHAGDLRVSDAIRLLEEKVGQTPQMAQGEVWRYTRHDNPTYQSCYMYGRTLILELRKDCRRQQGGAFSLKKFHDELCAHGSPPVPLLRELLL